RLGRPDDAINPLNEALDALPEKSIKHRSVLLTDLATARVKQGHLEEACSLATESLQIATRMKGVSAMRRLREFRAQLAPWRDHREVKRFTDELRAGVSVVQPAGRA